MRTLSFLTLLCVLMSGGSAQALTYGLAALSNGSTALVAEGRIHRSDATRLVSLLQQGGATPSTLVISSPGGGLVGALALGETAAQVRNSDVSWFDYRRHVWQCLYWPGTMPFRLRFCADGRHRAFCRARESRGSTFTPACDGRRRSRLPS